jgi:phosphopantetheine adenylyltransferase
MSLIIRFYEILYAVVELKNNKNNLYLTEEKYNIFLREVKVAKSVNVNKNSSLLAT